MKTQQHNCGNCGGRGTVEYVRKDGTYGIPRKCKQCFGRGNIYHETKEVAGLGLRPENEKDLSVHGFKTDVNTIKSKLLQVTGVKREFLEKYMRYNALATYLNTFIKTSRIIQTATGIFILSLCNVSQQLVGFLLVTQTSRTCLAVVHSLFVLPL